MLITPPLPYCCLYILRQWHNSLLNFFNLISLDLLKIFMSFCWSGVVSCVINKNQLYIIFEEVLLVWYVVLNYYENIMCRIWKYWYLKFEFLTAVTVKIMFFWDVVLCTTVDGHKSFEGTYCFHLKGRIWSCRQHVPLKFSTSVLQYIVLISEDCILNIDGLDDFDLVHLWLIWLFR